MVVFDQFRLLVKERLAHTRPPTPVRQRTRDDPDNLGGRSGSSRLHSEPGVENFFVRIGFPPPPRFRPCVYNTGEPLAGCEVLPMSGKPLSIVIRVADPVDTLRFMFAVGIECS